MATNESTALDMTEVRVNSGAIREHCSHLEDEMAQHVIVGAGAVGSAVATLPFGPKSIS